MPKIGFLTKFIYLSAYTIIHSSPHLMTADFYVSESDRLIPPVKLWLTSKHLLSCAQEAIAAGPPPTISCHSHRGAP